MKICLLSLSRIADDGRVRRQGDSLAEAGHEVVGIGLAGATSAPPAWPVIEVAHWDLGLMRDRITATLHLALGGRVPALADPVLLRSARGRALLRRAVGVHADAYQAHDWWVLPFAARAAGVHGVPYWYDSHEYAVEQRLDRLQWRALFPPVIRAVESRHIPGAAFVTVVGDGIADLLQHDYALEERPIVLRNVPSYEAVPRSRPGGLLTVLYHGFLHPGRHLETLIDSVAAWRQDRRLVLRGAGAPSYTEALSRRIDEVAPGRVTLDPPVPHDEVVRTAAEADIGIGFFPGTSRHVRHGLPNKLFEYVMAGLALCISDQPEMARVVRSHDLGVLIAGEQPTDIAAAVNCLTVASVAAHQQRSLAAARTLCWEQEKRKLLEAVDTHLEPRVGQ